jgi:hypothetical protein
MYKLTKENYVIKGNIRFSIADSPEYPNTNPDYLAYREWLDAGGVPEPADPPSPEEQREKFKAEREAAVKAITVTTKSGNTFDGDEISQGRMARAILALQATSAKSATWVLADNSAIDATAAELSEALSLAADEQFRLWVVIQERAKLAQN